MTILALLLAGACLCNAIPHLTAGLRGEPFPTPFARPRGIGDSSPVVNFLWGTGNLAVAGGLLMHSPHERGWMDIAAFATGWLALGLYVSRHFGSVRGG